MIDADGIAGAVGRLARERTEDSFGGWREEFAILAEAAEAGPDEREEVAFQRILLAAARAKLLTRAFQGLGHKSGGDGFLGGKVIEQRPGGDSGRQGNAAGGSVLPAVTHEKARGGSQNSPPGVGLRLGRDSHRTCRAPQMSMRSG